MAATTEILPITDTVTPADQAELAEIVRQAYADETPIYPLGGGVNPRYGLPGAKPGLALSLAKLNRVVDYPARDMTITVEAGVTMAELARELAAQGQRLPIDVPQPHQATLGGVIATNFSGPRRHGAGTMRDYLIGVSAVDGRGVPFHGGGRVVKNVAGYDFCKLLIGSLGTLAVVTQATLKVRPQPAASSFLYCHVTDLDEAERLLGDLVHSKVTPSAVELLTGPQWREDPALADGAEESAACLLVGLEGAEDEVRWMAEQLEAGWRSQGDPSGASSPATSRRCGSGWPSFPRPASRPR